MNTKPESILIFGGGELQLSLIEQCREMNLTTVIIDPNPNAPAKNKADFFEIVAGDDFEKTCGIVEKYSIKAIITAATDKPLMMMARIAEKYGFPFFSVEAARNSTDKFLMKNVFQKNNIPCARGFLVREIDDSLEYPLIIKPRDNSGSRGIIFCQTMEEAKKALAEAFSFSKKDSVLAEEFIGGQEYSVEALHFENRTHVLQITEKIVTPHPYNVELGHIQPANLSGEDREKIENIVAEIAVALKFENCASHTEVKINERGIFVIETSPRLGGDFITSQLVPLSTGINMERELIKIALGVTSKPPESEKNASAIFYFDFFEKNYVTKNLSELEYIKDEKGVVEFSFNLKSGMKIPKIKNSLDRYGFIILTAAEREILLDSADKYIDEIKAGI